MIPSIIKFFKGKTNPAILGKSLGKIVAQPIKKNPVQDGLVRYYDSITPSIVVAEDPRYTVVQKENVISGYDPETGTGRNIFINPNGQRDTNFVFSTPNRDNSATLTSPYKEGGFAMSPDEWSKLNQRHDQKMSRWYLDPNRKMGY